MVYKLFKGLGGGGCHVPARPYVPASLDHLRVEGHDLRDAQGRTGTWL